MKFLLLFLFWLSLCSGQLRDLRYSYCDNQNNYTNTSPFAKNLNTLLNSLPSQIQPNTYFYNLTVGKNHGVDQVNALGLCRGDLTSSDCNSCLSYASQNIRKVCPTQKGADTWYNGCTLRYSNKSIFGVLDTRHEKAFVSTDNASNPNTYDQQLGLLLQNLQTKAASGDSGLKFADGSSRVTDFESVYSLVECTPDLSSVDCSSCIEILINYVPKCCNGKRGAIIMTPSCDIRFDNFQYYQNNNVHPPSLSPILAPPLPPSNFTASTNNNIGKPSGATKVVIIIAIVAVSLLAVAAISFILFWRRKIRRRKVLVVSSGDHDHKVDEDYDSIVSLQFDLTTIKAATQNFSEANKLGHGGFGIVYKGRLENGQQIAVKRLSRNSRQGDQEFKNEIVLLAKLQHKNLVRLLGFCLEREEKLLVYDFVENASLDHFLFDPIKHTYLDWRERYKIITGIVRGILYLHEDSRLRIIHRDLKASNILLDEEMNPKISDFGMAKLFDVDQTQGDTSVIAGTYGYMPPEYALHGLFSVKSDVYSFGILLLEIITGQKCSSFHNEEHNEDLITFVWRNWKQKTIINIIDPSLSADARSEILRCIHIGLLCVQDKAVDRPTMSSVVLMLSSKSLTFPRPMTPAFQTQTGVGPLHIVAPSKNYRQTRGSSSANVDSITELSPR